MIERWHNHLYQQTRGLFYNLLRIYLNFIIAKKFFTRLQKKIDVLTRYNADTITCTSSLHSRDLLGNSFSYLLLLYYCLKKFNIEMKCLTNKIVKTALNTSTFIFILSKNDDVIDENFKLDESERNNFRLKTITLLNWEVYKKYRQYSEEKLEYDKVSS